MKIIYIANARIPTEKAHGIHIMKMCEALAQNNELELVLPKRLNKIKADAFLYYGITSNFKIKRLPCLDLIPFDRYLGHLALWLESASFFCAVFTYLLLKKTDFIYTRDKFLLPLALFKGNLAVEIHTFPKHYFLYAFFLKRVKKITVITQGLKDLFIGRGIAPSNILVAPDGVDLSEFAIQETQADCRQKLSLPQDKKIVLYTGHLYGWKGAQVLAEASQYLTGEAVVYFVGGTERDIKKFKAQNSEYRINVVGHRPYQEIPFWLKAADVLVLPNSGKEEISRSWTSPMKLFEYMASGRPIVASALPSIEEILNTDNAILVRPDDFEDLARGISEVLQNQALSDRISEKALIDAENYSWGKRVEKIIGFIGL